MKKVIQFVCIGLFISITTFAQKHQSFTLNGEIKADSGIIILLPIGNESYYPDEKVIQETKVVNGRFTLKGSIYYPTAFIIGLKVDSQWKYISSFFIVEPIEQTIFCNIDSLRETPNIHNSSMQELGFYRSKKRVTGEKNDEFLSDYTKTHSDSYVAFWLLVYEFDYAYSTVLDSTFAHFLPALKNNFTGKILAKKMKLAQKTAVGGIFPNLLLQRIDGKKSFILNPNLQEKFTFIDFWFSHCGPCISQFNSLKNIYTTYNGSVLKMLGISVDTKENQSAWKKAITLNKLPWQQFLDINGEEALKLNISHYPSNFLIDSAGKIIQKDISPTELEKILTQYLQKQ